jgi:hypothetical protein
MFTELLPGNAMIKSIAISRAHHHAKSVTDDNTQNGMLWAMLKHCLAYLVNVLSRHCQFPGTVDTTYKYSNQ